MYSQLCVTVWFLVKYYAAQKHRPTVYINYTGHVGFEVLTAAFYLFGYNAV
jgi:hypothetical protein